MVIVETRTFTRRIEALLSADEYRELQIELVRRPETGDVIPGTGGLRKHRWSVAGRGKRGGARVIYYWHTVGHQLLMLYVFAKNERTDLTPAQRQALRRVVEAEYP